MILPILMVCIGVAMFAYAVISVIDAQLSDFEYVRLVGLGGGLLCLLGLMWLLMLNYVPRSEIR